MRTVPKTPRPASIRDSVVVGTPVLGPTDIAICGATRVGTGTGSFNHVEHLNAEAAPAWRPAEPRSVHDLNSGHATLANDTPDGDQVIAIRNSRNVDSDAV